MSTAPGLGVRQTPPKDPDARIPPIPSSSLPTPTPGTTTCTGRRLAARTTGCACQLSDRKRPRPASPESAIYLYVVPCQWFMPWGSEIRLSLCWCYAPCFAQKTPRGQAWAAWALSLLAIDHGSAPARWERGSRDPAETLGSDS